MQAIEITGTIDAEGRLFLDQPLQVSHSGRVRVIVLLEDSESASSHEQPTPTPAESRDQKSTNSQYSFDRDAPPIWELVAQISAQVPDEEWEKLPTDLARRFDYYQKQRQGQD